MTGLPFRTLCPGDPDYPRLLAMAGSPPELFLAGELLPGDGLAVAIVGSRQPTPYGLDVARRLSRELAARGVTVVSGFARGIDSAAHQAALAAGGRTVAVLGCGLDVEYPTGSSPLKRAIAASGAVLSEFPPGTPPQAYHFPRRNRILAGLSLGVVVVEGGEQSGSLNTARWAADYGREVMAVPGRVDNPAARGTFLLLREGAVPVSRGKEVLEAVGALPADLSAAAGAKAEAASKDDSPVLERLAGGPARPEEMSGCGLPLPDLLIELSRLEISGLVSRVEGGYYALLSTPTRSLT